MSRHPDDSALPDIERAYPRDVCPCGHHITQHIHEGDGWLPCRACECNDYDGPDTEGS